MRAEAECSDQVVGGQVGHAEARAQGGTGNVRRERDVLSVEQCRMHFRLALVHIQAGRKDALVRQRLRQRGVINDAAAREMTSVAVGFICASSAAPMAWWLSLEYGSTSTR